MGASLALQLHKTDGGHALGTLLGSAHDLLCDFKRLQGRDPKCACLFGCSVGIPGFVEVRSEREGRPTVVLTHACGASAEVGCNTAGSQRPAFCSTASLGSADLAAKAR